MEEIETLPTDVEDELNGESVGAAVTERGFEVDDPDDDPDDDPGDDEDHAGDAVLERGRKLLADAEAKLAGVERALARLDAGNYGLCEVCNEPIAPARLTEDPSLERCDAHDPRRH